MVQNAAVGLVTHNVTHGSLWVSFRDSYRDHFPATVPQSKASDKRKNALRRRFWLETGMAIVTSIVFAITLVRNDWIEIAFGVDPDSTNGTLEWVIVGVLVVVSITLFALASYEWRNPRTDLCPKNEIL